MRVRQLMRCRKILTAAVMLLIGSGVLLFSVKLTVAAVITPDTATSSGVIFPGFSNSPTQLIDGSGLSLGGPILTRTHESIHTKGLLFNDNLATNEIVFNWVGGPVDLTGVHIWQYEQAGCCTGRGVNTVDVSFSTDNGATFGASIPLSFNSAAVNPGPEIAQTQSFALQTGVTNVKFTNMTDFPLGPNPGHIGLNEVRFEDNVAPPPPPPPPPIAPSMVGVDSVADLISRDLIDTAVGAIIAHNEVFASPGTIDNWMFYSDNTPGALAVGNQITPLIINNLNQITAIGTTRTNDGSGLQSFDFGLVSGSGDVGPTSRFAWKDGGNGTDNDTIPGNASGVIEWTDNTGDSVTFFGAPHTSFAVGDTLGVVIGSLPRTYSVKANAIPEPSSIILIILGICSLGFWKMKN